MPSPESVAFMPSSTVPNQTILPSPLGAMGCAVCTSTIRINLDDTRTGDWSSSFYREMRHILRCRFNNVDHVPSSSVSNSSANVITENTCNFMTSGSHGCTGTQQVPLESKSDLYRLDIASRCACLYPLSSMLMWMRSEWARIARGASPEVLGSMA